MYIPHARNPILKTRMPDSKQPTIASLLARVEGRSRAEIRLCISDDTGREIDVALPGDFPVTPQIKGAIKAVQGVLAVEDI